jgi:hypothetical protein
VKKPKAKPHRPKAPTQKRRAEELLKRLKGGDFETDNALYALRDEAQNAPPEGYADGSISPERWRALNLACVSLALLKRSFNDWRFAK